jgi:hypothetical protein
MEAKIVETKPIPEHLPGNNTSPPMLAKRASTFPNGPPSSPKIWPRRTGRHAVHLVSRQSDHSGEISDFDTTGAKAVLSVGR